MSFQKWEYRVSSYFPSVHASQTHSASHRFGRNCSLIDSPILYTLPLYWQPTFGPFSSRSGHSYLCESEFECTTSICSNVQQCSIKISDNYSRFDTLHRIHTWLGSIFPHRKLVCNPILRSVWELECTKFYRMLQLKYLLKISSIKCLKYSKFRIEAMTRTAQTHTRTEIEHNECKR